MSSKSALSLITIPIEIVYRILDNLDELTILLSVRDRTRKRMRSRQQNLQSRDLYYILPTCCKRAILIECLIISLIYYL